MTDQAPELLPCPFCHSTNVDPEGWATLPQYANTPEERSGPACDDCGASAPTIAIWNTRFPVATVAATFTNDQWHDALMGAPASRPTPSEPVAQVREALELLSLEWRGWAQAIRLMDGKREISDPASLRQAAAYEECGEKLRAALTSERPSESATFTDEEWHDALMGTPKARPEAAVAWLPKIAPSKCFCCNGDLEISGVSYSCEKQSTEHFHIDDVVLAIPHEEAVRAQAIEECAKIAEKYSDIPCSGPHNNTLEAFQHGMNHMAGCVDSATCIEEAIRALSPTLASERVSERETMTSVPADRVIGELPSEQVWRPIESAPKDTPVLLGWWVTWPELFWEVSASPAGSTKGGWLHGQATHWMPLPPPPDGSLVLKKDERSGPVSSPPTPSPPHRRI